MGAIFPNTDETVDANKFSRGWLAVVLGESGVADALRWIRRKADGSFDLIEVPVAAYAPGGTDVAVSDGGTGAGTAAGARTNLGVPAIVHTHAESDVTNLVTDLSGKQPLSAELTAFASTLLANFLVIKIDRDNTNFTNTDTSNDADAVSTTIVLPAGTWTIYAVGSATCFHSAIADFQVKVSINGDVGASSTLASGAAAGDRITTNPVHSVAGIASATITCKLVFHSATAGTMTVDTSSIFIVATRTA